MGNAQWVQVLGTDARSHYVALRVEVQPSALGHEACALHGLEAGRRIVMGVRGGLRRGECSH
ncbi:hypothetical protein D3C72_2153500 [compost metagenome]